MSFSEPSSSTEPSIQIPVPEIGDPPTPARRSHWRVIWTGVLAFLTAMAMCIVLVIAIMIVTLSITGFTGPESFKNLMQSPAFLLGMLLAAEVPLAAVGLFLRFLDRKTEFQPPRMFEHLRFSAIAAGIGAGVVLLVFGALNAYIATAIFGKASTESMEALMRGLAEMKGHPGKAALGVFTIGVLGPVCEELFFRGALFARGRTAGRAWTAALVSSILFAMAHLNGAMSIYYFGVGLTMCLLFIKTRTLAAPIAAHMTINLMACVAMLATAGK